MQLDVAKLARDFMLASFRLFHSCSSVLGWWVFFKDHPLAAIRPNLGAFVSTLVLDRRHEPIALWCVFVEWFESIRLMKHLLGIVLLGFLRRVRLHSIVIVLSLLAGLSHRFRRRCVSVCLVKVVVVVGCEVVVVIVVAACIVVKAGTGRRGC